MKSSTVPSRRRRREGIFVEDSTWEEITTLMQSLGIDKEVGFTLKQSKTTIEKPI